MKIKTKKAFQPLLLSALCALLIGTPGPRAQASSTNLWIEFKGALNSEATLTLHNTTDVYMYEAFAKTNLNGPFWIPVACPVWGTPGTNQTLLTICFPLGFQWENNSYLWPTTNFIMFLLSLGVGPVGGDINCLYLDPADSITITWPVSSTDSSQNVTSYISDEYCFPATNLVVNLPVKGSAIYGVDYTIAGGVFSNNTITTTIPAGSGDSAPLVIKPIYKNQKLIPGVSLTFGLAPNGSYLIDNGAYSQTIIISNKQPIILNCIAPDLFNITNDTITITGSGFWADAPNPLLHIEDWPGWGMDDNGYYMLCTYVSPTQLTAVYGGPGDGILGPGSVMIYYEDDIGEISNGLSAKNPKGTIIDNVVIYFGNATEKCLHLE